jgi:hypothetical protein
VLAGDAARQFANQLEHSFAGTADFLRRKFDSEHFKGTTCVALRRSNSLNGERTG